MPYKVLQALHKTRKIIFIFLMWHEGVWKERQLADFFRRQYGGGTS